MAIRLRPTEPADEWLFWQLRVQEDPTLKLDEHKAWWESVVEHRFVAYDGPVFVGIIRVTPMKFPTTTTGVISILVTKSERGKGLGTQMLSSIRRIAKDCGLTKLVARVNADNLPSQKAFLSAKYAPTTFEVTL